MSQRGIYERTPGEWYIRYADASGKIRREKAGTYAVASKLYHKRKTEVLQGKKLPESLRRAPVSFRELCEDAIVYARDHHHNETILVTYGGERVDYRAPLLLEVFGSWQADGVTPQQIERELGQVARERGWTPATFNRYKAFVSLAYRLGIDNNKVSVNPAHKVRNRQENNKRVRYLSREQYEELRRVVRKRWPERLAELDFAAYTGLRFGNQYGLTWDMVDWSARMLHVPRTKNEEPLHVPLGDEALAALRTVRMRGDGTGHVFRSSLHPYGPVKDNRGWFKEALRLAGITDFRWHDLRHCFASWLRQKGVPLETIAELLGHKGLQMSMRYAHLGAGHLREAVNRLKRTDTKTDTSTDSIPEEQAAYVQ